MSVALRHDDGPERIRGMGISNVIWWPGVSLPNWQERLAEPRRRQASVFRICQFTETNLVAESVTQNRRNSESLRTETLTKFSHDKVPGIRATTFDTSSRLVNIAAR